MKIKFRGLLLPAVSLTGLLTLGCGSVANLGGRPTPPDFDKLGYPRAMVAVQGTATGFLQFLDVLHNTASNKENTIHSYTVSGFTGTNPLSIQDYPGYQVAYIYSSGNGQFQEVNTGTDAAGPAAVGLPGISSSIYVSPDFKYVYAANPLVNGGYFTVVRQSDGYVKTIALPNISKIAMAPGGQAVLAFQYNSDNVFQLNGINGNTPDDTVTQLAGTFDRPINAVYSADGSYAYVLNCGPQCGGTTASISVFSLNTSSGVYPQVANIAIPGGAYYALQSGNILYVSGMEPQGGSLTGELTQLNVDPSCLSAAGVNAAGNSGNNCFTIATTLPMSDGNTIRIRLADDNTLWVGNTNCTNFLRGLQGGVTGCVTDVSLDDNGNILSTLVEGSHGDVGGLAPIQQSGTKYIFGHEMYTTEGGQVYIYATQDGSAIDASLVQVVGYATDINFVDGIYNTQP